MFYNRLIILLLKITIQGRFQCQQAFGVQAIRQHTHHIFPTNTPRVFHVVISTEVVSTWNTRGVLVGLTLVQLLCLSSLSLLDQNCRQLFYSSNNMYARFIIIAINHRRILTVLIMVHSNFAWKSDNILVTTYFKALDFIEWFDLILILIFFLKSCLLKMFQMIF